MLLHKITYERINRFDEIEIKTKWVGSGKDAGAFRKVARQMNGYISNSIETKKIDVPTNKIGLIEFINKIQK